MCGLAGWIGESVVQDGVAERMMMALRHRGPNSSDMRTWDEATLIHTRLSILDLTASGNQPIANEDGTVWTVFNGEIYNHHELRRALELRGHRFQGRSDSEVIPHLYEEEGPTCIAKLRGMFALAIFDLRSQTLVLARDRFGIKPLFYAPGTRRLGFASEIRALLELPGIDDRPDRQAVYDFAALFYIPAPETFYAGIRSLLPGELLVARSGQHGLSWKTRLFHQWAIAPNFELTLDQAADRTQALLKKAVQRQMESDVPLGTLLSGGIDSSLVSSAAQKASRAGIRTFNVRFSDQEFDETWAALEVARHIGSHHTTLDMEQGGGNWNEITGLLRHAGQPFADTSLFAVHGVCRLMRRHLTVALSGDGGDEAFGGYNTFWQLGRIVTLQRIPSAVLSWTTLGMAFLGNLGIAPSRFGKRISEFAGADDVSIMQNLFSWIREDEHGRLCVDEKEAQPIRRLFEPQWDFKLPKHASRVERLSAYTTEIYTRLSLPNDFLFKVDTASMRESLEVRVPMLDEDLFDFGLSLPHRLKVRSRAGKLVLRAVADRWLPPRVAQKPKMGFGLPVDTWVDAEFRAQLQDTLLGSTSCLRDFFRPDVYRPMVEAFCRKLSYPGVSRQGLYQRAIMLLSLQLTLENKRSGIS